MSVDDAEEHGQVQMSHSSADAAAGAHGKHCVFTGHLLYKALCCAQQRTANVKINPCPSEIFRIVKNIRQRRIKISSTGARHFTTVSGGLSQPSALGMNVKEKVRIDCSG